MIVFTALLFICLSAQGAFSLPFEGHQVVRANIISQAQLNEVDKANLDVWSSGSLLHLGFNDIVVNDSSVHTLNKFHIQYKVVIEDLAGAIEAERLFNDVSVSKDTWFDAYHNYADIVDYSTKLATTYSNLLTYVPAAGKSFEGKNIFVLNVKGGKGPKKSKLLLLGGQHAREWIAPATVLYIANKLVTEYGSNTAVTELVDKFDIVLVPVLNPDGYTYTWTSSANRLWRKNRRLNNDKSYGVDLNRNWGFHWCESGASKTPSSDIYCGSGPFSEPETQAIESIITTYGPFGGAIDFHSYGQLIMRPYGWTQTAPPGNEELTRVGEGMKDVMLAATGVKYTNQAIWQLYLSAGSSADYFIGPSNISLSYGFEARDDGKYGFLLPASEIAPSGEENFAAIAYLAKQIK